MSTIRLHNTGIVTNALFAVPEMHRNIFRGKNLGNVYTDAQIAAIANSTFDDLYVGDYWQMGDRIYRIADINFCLGKGDKACNTPHIIVVPDSPLYTAKMNNDNTTSNGYAGSYMHESGLEQAKEMVKADFGGNYLLNHRDVLTNATKDGYPSGSGFYDSTVELMSETMVLGAPNLRPMSTGKVMPTNHTLYHMQLALFQLAPFFIQPTRESYWLRDIISGASYAYIYYDGRSAGGSASGELGVRPMICISGVQAAADEPMDGPEIIDTYIE